MKNLVASVNSLVEERLPDLLLLLEDCLKIPSLSRQEGPLADLLLSLFQKENIPAARTPRGSVLALLVPENAARISSESHTGGFSETPTPAEGSDGPDAGCPMNLLKKSVAMSRSNGVALLAFNAHMDVVEPGEETRWENPPFDATIKGERVYGRGTCDMKGALAAMALSLVLGRQLSSHHPLKRAVLACFVTEEEVGEGLAFKEILCGLGFRPDAVILGEPSEMQIARGQRGKLEFFLRAAGKRAHTSVPEVGENAAYKIARAILAVEALDRGEYRTVGPAPAHIMERSTLVATSFRTIPFTKSSVPDAAEAHVTVRLAKGENFETIKEKLRQRGTWPDVAVELVTYRGDSYTGQPSEWPANHPAWEIPKDHPFFSFLKETTTAVLDREPTDRIWPFSTDGVVSAGQEKIPTLGIGPGREDVAHIADEYVEIGQLREALALYSILPFAHGNFEGAKAPSF